jgi:putative membrane fusion protein
VSKDREEKSSKFNFILALIIVVAVVYFITNGTRLINQSIDTFIVSNGSLSYEESLEGYLIRDEQVLEGDTSSEAQMIQIMADNQKAAKDEAVFRYYAEDEDQIVAQIGTLNAQINEEMAKTNATIPSSDIIGLENQIEGAIDEIKGANDLQKVEEKLKLVDEYQSKKIEIMGHLSPDENIKKLVSQRTVLQNILEEKSKIVYAPRSGIVSYRVDELENVLTTDNFDYLSTEMLDKLELKVGSAIPISRTKGKIVDNFKCYLATPISTEYGQEVEVGDVVKIRFSNSKEINATIVYIKEEDKDNRIIVFEILDYVQDLVQYRKISFDIIWWKYSGLKVSNQAIIEENERSYIETNREGKMVRILVKVLRQNETYSIVTNYEDEELKEMGFTDDEIANRYKIKLYDEVVLH